MQQKLLYLFTRTPLHVGAGSSVGAIDQPIQRERHTGFPIIPGTTIKGVFADAWNGVLETNGTGQKHRGKSDAAWLFGSDDANEAAAGALQFSEAKLLAFPIRSAKGSFAWITCPLILSRYVRESGVKLPPIEVADEKALFPSSGPLALSNKVVLEEYTFTHGGELPAGLAEAFKALLADEVWQQVSTRLVIVSDGMMSFFATSACEVAQHVRINDETGTAAGGALFNQENVPSETMFYSLLNYSEERSTSRKKDERRPAEQAASTFADKLSASGHVFQFGGDASTGLGFCTVALKVPVK